MKTWIKKLKEMRACREAIKWCEAGEYMNLQDAWQNCERADWMFWLITETIKDDADRKPLASIACKCARLSLPYTTKGDDRPLKAIEAAEAWAQGKATLDEVQMAAESARLASSAARSVARSAVEQQCADIVREYFPTAPEM